MRPLPARVIPFPASDFLLLLFYHNFFRAFFFYYITYIIVLWYLTRVHSFLTYDDARAYTILIPRDARTCHTVMILSDYNIKYYCLRTKSIDLFYFFFSTAGCASFFLNAHEPPLTFATTVCTAAEHYNNRVTTEVF